MRRWRMWMGSSEVMRPSPSRIFMRRTVRSLTKAEAWLTRISRMYSGSLMKTMGVPMKLVVGDVAEGLVEVLEEQDGAAEFHPGFEGVEGQGVLEAGRQERVAGPRLARRWARVSGGGVVIAGADGAGCGQRGGGMAGDARRRRRRCVRAICSMERRRDADDAVRVRGRRWPRRRRGCGW